MASPRRRPPGGVSSVNLAWGEDASQFAGARCSSNAFADNGRQNSQNVLTDRPMTRIQAPPGGVSSLSLAWDDNSSRSRPSTSDPSRHKQSTPWSQRQYEQEDEEDTEASPYLEDVYSNAAFGQRISSSSSNNFANGQNQNSGNVLTDRPSTRVDAPPGGASSFSLGWQRGDDDRSSRTPSAAHRDVLMPRTPPRTPPGNIDDPRLRGYDCQSFPESSRHSYASRADDMVFGHHQQQQRTSSNSFASGSNQNCGNVITDRPSTRVHAPPGGSSSFSLSSDPYGIEAGRRTPRSAGGRDHEADRDSYYGENLNPPAYESSGRRTPPKYRHQDDAYGHSESSGRRTPPKYRQQDDAFGQRLHKSSSNAFAHGSNQNCGNVLTDTPSTRVQAPPGGASSFSLGGGFNADEFDQRTPRSSRNAWDEYSNNGGSSSSRLPGRAGPRPKTPPKTPPRTPPRASDAGDYCREDLPKSSSNSRYEMHPSSASERRESGHERRNARSSGDSEYEPSEYSTASHAAGKPTFDQSSLRTLKARMGKKQIATPSSQAGSQIYDERHGYGNSSTTASEVARSSSVPLLQPKSEVEGSQPRKWKPAKAPKAPPGGNPTFHPAQDGTSDARLDGRKRFPDMGAGNNRDMNAIEALRFYQEEERLGKNVGTKVPLTANNHARDSHRYYLAAEGKPELIPGKAQRRPSDNSHKGLLEFYDNEVPASQSIATGNSLESPSECDSLPLGAEWSSCRFDRFDRIASREQLKV